MARAAFSCWMMRLPVTRDLRPRGFFARLRARGTHLKDLSLTLSPCTSRPASLRFFGLPKDFSEGAFLSLGGFFDSPLAMIEFTASEERASLMVHGVDHRDQECH